MVQPEPRHHLKRIEERGCICGDDQPAGNLVQLYRLRHERRPECSHRGRRSHANRREKGQLAGLGHFSSVSGCPVLVALSATGRGFLLPLITGTIKISSLPLPTDKDRRSARIAAVEEHIRLENAHDLEAVLRTFGDAARYDDEAWGEHYTGHDGVRQFYEQLMRALPDLEIEVQHQHVTDDADAILVEVVIRGTHLGAWRGLPATGRRIEFPLCGVYTFDAAHRLAGEKIYYDRATVLNQLGVFHDPQSVLGRISTFVTHPVTMARAAGRKLLGR